MVIVQANGGTKVVRIAGTGDVISGAGALLAAGARHVQGARDILQGRQAGVFPLSLPLVCHISAVVNPYSLIVHCTTLSLDANAVSQEHEDSLCHIADI